MRSPRDFTVVLFLGKERENVQRVSEKQRTASRGEKMC